MTHGPARRPPLILLLTAALACGGAILPLAWLFVRAAEADDAWGEWVFTARNGRYLLNTVGLAAATLGVVSVLGLTAAWLTARSDLPRRRLWTLAGILPLATPAYITAYALLGMGGYQGLIHRLGGPVLPRPSGFWGALIALSLYNFPYMFLNLRASLLQLNPALEEAARSLGHSPASVFFRVILPQLRPAFGVGALLVSLHVLGDFGVVSLMRYETFSYALYIQYEAGFNRTYAALLALLLLGLTALVVAADALLFGKLKLEPASGASTRRIRATRLGVWRWPAMGLLAAVPLLGVAMPLATIVFWLFQETDLVTLGDLAVSALASLQVSVPAALAATLLAVPVALLSVRYPGPLSRLIERTSYLGYAVPSVAFALSLIFFSINTAPWLYQSLGLLVYAYALHYLAEALGPIRSALLLSNPRLEEVARTLGLGRFVAFRKVTLPLVRHGLIVALALVFLSAMKELPLAFLVAPPDFQTLAVNVWTYSEDAYFAEAAPFALAILILSAGFVAVLLMRDPPAAQKENLSAALVIE